eukprot:9125527-Lingulodinium_polyedra.AAC.1
MHDGKVSALPAQRVAERPQQPQARAGGALHAERHPRAPASARDGGRQPRAVVAAIDGRAVARVRDCVQAPGLA